MIFTSDIIKALDIDTGNTTDFICFGEPTTESDYLSNCKYIKGEENNETLYHDTPIYTWKEISDKRVVLENEFKKSANFSNNIKDSDVVLINSFTLLSLMGGLTLDNIELVKN